MSLLISNANPMEETTVKDNVLPSYELRELRVSNFQRIKDAKIRPNGPGILMITGRNEQGKTSLLDSISAAIGGPSFTPKNPIRKGQTEAEVFIDFGGLRMTRRWEYREDKSIKMSLALEYANGEKPREKQTVLDKLRGTELAADPLEFTRLPAKEQFDVLRGLVPGIDFDVLAAERKKLFEDRTQIGRDHDRASNAANAIDVPQGTPPDIIDVSALVADMRQAADFNTELNDRAQRREAAEKAIEESRNRADALMIEARELNTKADELEKKLKLAPKLPEPKNLAELEKKFATAESTNAAVRLLHAQDRHRDNAKRLNGEYVRATEAIEALDKKKNDAIAQAKLPIKTMSFGDNEILMDGLPFAQASQAAKLRASTGIAMALKPDLKVLCIKDGSLLDSESLKLLGEMVEKNKFVVLLERVSDGEPIGIRIEDGEIAS
jgi:predicted ATP-dependent endonuclease of OLD family